MTTFNVAVSASADDGHENSSGTVNTTNTFSIIVDATNEWIGVRFQNVTVPSGATINSASLSFVPSSSGDEPNHPIYGNDVDNAAAFTAGATSDISTRTRTTATVTWSSTNLGATGTSLHSTPDLATIVQEIIDRAGWASGNAMAFMLQGSSDGTRDLEVYLYDNGSLIPELDIDYTAGGGADPEGSLIGGKLIRGGLLLHGVLGR